MIVEGILLTICTGMLIITTAMRYMPKKTESVKQEKIPKHARIIAVEDEGMQLEFYVAQPVSIKSTGLWEDVGAPVIAFEVSGNNTPPIGTIVSILLNKNGTYRFNFADSTIPLIGDAYPNPTVATSQINDGPAITFTDPRSVETFASPISEPVVQPLKFQRTGLTTYERPKGSPRNFNKIDLGE